VCASQSAQIEGAMILVYGDDSEDERKERVSAVAVVFGTGKAWKWLQPKWKARNRVIPFHAKDCESDHGDYENSPHEKNKALYKELVTLVARSDVAGFGIAFDLAAQRKILPHALDLAYEVAFILILERLLVPAVHYAQLTKFAFDISTKNEYNAGLIYANFRDNNPDGSNFFFREITFGSAKESARLQVADLLAFECMKVLDNMVGPVKRQPRGSWKALVATERFACMCFGEEWFEGLKNDLPNLRQRLGFTQRDYLEWLKKKNRQHSKSNIFHFANIIQKNLHKK
jgi:hypothetical protein